MPGPAPPARESRISISHSHRAAAVRAVVAKALPGEGRKRAAVWGSSAQLLDQLVAEHGVDEVLAAVDQLDAGAYQVPSLLAALGDLLAAGVLPDDPPAPASVMSELQLDQQRRALDVKIATYQAEGYDVPPDLLDERTRLDDLAAGYPDQVSDRGGAGS